MAHAFANLLSHVVFSTKEREPLIAPRLKPGLLAYMGGIIRELGGKAMMANSMPDHVHLLLSLPPSVPIAEALRVIKTNSSRWVRQRSSRKSQFRLANRLWRVQRQRVECRLGFPVYS